MQFNVTIEKALPEQSGVGKSGKTWRKRTYVGVHDNSNPAYPKRIAFDVLGDKVDQINLVAGQQYAVDIDFDTKEWNGKYFLSASCWRATAANNYKQTTNNTSLEF